MSLACEAIFEKRLFLSLCSVALWNMGKISESRKKWYRIRTLWPIAGSFRKNSGSIYRFGNRSLGTKSGVLWKPSGQSPMKEEEKGLEWNQRILSKSWRKRRRRRGEWRVSFSLYYSILAFSLFVVRLPGKLGYEKRMKFLFWRMKNLN